MPLPAFPTHLTLSPEERARLGLPEPGAVKATRAAHLLRQHEFGVTYPDGAQGRCQYRRDGPIWHTFEFGYGDDPRGIGVRYRLPRQHYSDRLGNTPADIEAKGNELAVAAFAAAVKREQDERFRRAASPYGKAFDPTLCQFSVKRAKQIGGKYALCVRVCNRLVPSGSCLLDTLEEANDAWLRQPQPETTPLVIPCACRFSRRWEVPRFNRLYGTFPHLKL